MVFIVANITSFPTLWQIFSCLISPGVVWVLYVYCPNVAALCALSLEQESLGRLKVVTFGSDVRT